MAARGPKNGQKLILTPSFNSPSKIHFKRGVTCHYLNELKNGSVVLWRPTPRLQIGIIRSVHRPYLCHPLRGEISGNFHSSSTLQRVEAPQSHLVP